MCKLTCEKICKECPFSKNSLPGYLADYSTQDILNVMQWEWAFICHLMIDEDMTWDVAKKKILDGEKKMCRGFVESIIKSCQSPKHSDLLKACIAEVREKGLSDESMAKWDFVKHHTLLNER